MPTLHRILKFTAAAVMGLLVVAWALSWSIWFGVEINDYAKSGVTTALRAEDGYMIFSWNERRETDNLRGQRSILFQHQGSHPTRPSVLASYSWYLIDDGFLRLVTPIATLATVVLPFAVGSLTSFRFRLWHYLAYTALVAVELAYYLRWQQ